ncbi:MAG: hypothetical protein K2P88_17565 [Chitinophagaceae bacterium]|uniref:hypothetical protein n=1 Tax=unclassified Paraflavitalea TaxID=2798305 RepID=UPI003D327761|nr:hypothetical protein [Chitinophagaceae bacterium]
MKLFLTIGLGLLTVASAYSQRPTTTQEKEEDARILKTLSAAMPKELQGALEPAERSWGVSDLGGTSGFMSDMNFSTRNAFPHQYTIAYQYTKIPAGLEKKFEKAQLENNIEYLTGISNCEVEIYINELPAMKEVGSSFVKINNAYCQNAYRDSKAAEQTYLFFGPSWSVKSEAIAGEDVFGKPKTTYSLKASHPIHPGTEVQWIVVSISGHSDIADPIMSKIDWKSVAQLIGTGKFKDIEEETPLKKFTVENPIPPVQGNNTLSFTYTDESGKQKEFSISSSVHDRKNCVLIRNHHENRKVLEHAHTDFYIEDDRDHNQLFMMSLPIVRTTGTVTASFDSDYDYQIMWRGNPDNNHSFTASSVEITITKWAPVGGFIEGYFSGTATIKDHNNGTDELPTYTIKNGKFRIRRMPDELK